MEFVAVLALPVICRVIRPSGANDRVRLTLPHVPSHHEPNGSNVLFASMRRANVLLCLGLGQLACRDDRADMAPPPAALTVSTPKAGDFDAYERGISAAIQLLRRRLKTGDSITWPVVDSVAARAAGLSIEQFRAVSRTVESSLRERAATATELQRLDSLRVELKVLRVRVEARP